MSRPAAALLAALALSACSKKEEVVVAAPAAAKQPAAQAPMAPAEGQGQLPPGHPPLDPGTGAAPDDGMGGGMQGGAPPAHGGAMSSGADVGDVKVPKATGPNARTVAEVFAQRATLKGKAVAVRGKVVKYNAGIMGKNWLHLRDGSGTAGQDNDVTVTSAESAQLGEVVTVRGTVAVDQDIGMGTPYPVIVEDAKVAR